MNKKIESQLKRILKSIINKLEWHEGMIKAQGPGHTMEVAELPYNHSGRTSSLIYAASVVYGDLDKALGLKLLQELSKLQLKDSKSNQYGCFRWYREETGISDANATFFIMMPLVFTYLFCPEKIPAAHMEVLDEMMSHALFWFIKECSDPVLYYPNKIISDGAMLLGISKILGSEQGYSTGVEFFKRWDEYTTRRGWGYGENISFIYLSVILNALQLARNALGDREPELAAKLGARINQGLDLVLFHDRKEFVPTIRSYNFKGSDNVYGWMNAAAGLRLSLQDIIGIGSEEPDYTGLICLKMFEEYIDKYEFTEITGYNDVYKCISEANKVSLPAIRIEHIFDQAFSYTWKGKTGKLGSINKYPVIPGCYQWPSWGLGWQSMPVAFLVNDEQFSFLRIFVKEGENLRAHPALDMHKAYLNPALFREEYLPDVKTYCSQNENVLLVLRNISNLNNSCSEIADAWTINRFGGRMLKYTADEHGSFRQWMVLKYKYCLVAISALKGIKIGEGETADIPIEVIHRNAELTVKQVLYKGVEKLLQQQKIEAGWVVVFIDEDLEEPKIQEFLSRVEISDKSYIDNEVPRNGYTKIREINISIGGETKATLIHDPHLFT